MKRHIACLSLAFALSGCGYKTWWNPPFTAGTNPNLPVSDSENMQRTRGLAPDVSALTTEQGDIWPGPLKPPPTLADLESNGGLTSQTEQPASGSPLRRGNDGPSLSPNPSAGSSSPSGYAQPGLVTPRSAPPLSSYAAPPAAPPARGPGGQVVQTPSGPTVTTGGGAGYQTSVSPGGGQSIIVPNGNGTSTVIHADGHVETIPTPK